MGGNLIDEMISIEYPDTQTNYHLGGEDDTHVTEVDVHGSQVRPAQRGALKFRFTFKLRGLM